MTWLFYALLSAAAAAATALLSKAALSDVPSTLATAIRTIVIAVFAWGIVIALGEHRSLGAISQRSLLFLALSGVATAVSWLAYFKALQIGTVTNVVSIDKLSLPITLVLAVLLFKEPLGWRTAAGVTLMTIGALLTISRS
jgi:transporter family protein